MKSPLLLVLKATLVISLTSIQAANASDKTLQSLLMEKTKAVHEVNRRARKTLTQTLKNKAFTQYFAAEDKQSQAKAQKKIEKALLKTQKLFDIEEMCLIDRSGAELVRVDAGHLSHELAADEHEAVFFEPGFKLGKGRSLVSSIYFSPDSHSWVVAYVSPVYHDNEAQALLHYEHDLDYLQNKIIAGVESEQIILALSGDGLVIADSREPINFRAHQSSSEPTPDEYFSDEIFPGIAASQVTDAAEQGRSINGYNVKSKAAGKWTLIAMEPAS